MRLKKLLLTAGVLVPVTLAAQPAVSHTGSRGYLERARLMYESYNYVGAIDQLNHLFTLPDAGEVAEEAELLKALSLFERGEGRSLDELIAFIENHPTSPLATTAQMKIGNYYFYRGDWENALLSYSLVRERAQDADSDEDLLYRQAYCHLRLGNMDDAQALYNKLSATRRYGAATQFYQAYIDYANGDYDMALDRFLHIKADGELEYQSQYYITQIKYHQHKYADVIAQGTVLLSEQNNDYFDAELNRMVGESYYHQGNEAQARVYLKRYFDSPEGEIYRTAAYTMGVLDYKDGNYDRTINLMPLATGQDDALAQSAWLYLGQAKLKINDLNGAARAFEQAAAMRHDEKVRETAFYNYAISQNQGARTPFDKSIDMFEQFLNDYPKSQYKDNVEGYLTDAYLTTTDYAKALTSINHLKNPGSKVKRAKQYVLYNLGVQSLANNDNNQAINYLKQAVDLGNLDKTVLNESRLWLAEAQYRAGNYKEATSNQMNYVNTATLSDDNYALAQYNLGYSLFQQRRYTEAKQAFKKAIDAKQLTGELKADAYNRLGDTQYYTQDYTAAQASYDAAMSDAAGTAKDYSMYQKAMMLGMTKDYDAQVAAIDAMLKAYPKSELAPQAMLDKGNALAAAARGKEAVQAYNTLLKTYPKSVEARKGLLQMAIVDKNMNNEDAALEAYKTVIKSYPSSEEAQVAAEDMKLIYADRGQLNDFEKFLNSVPNGPRVDVTEIDRLNFEAAEKAAIADVPSIEKMQNYLQQNPNGAYAAKARYYIARHNYNKGNLKEALTGLNEALKGNADASFAEDAMSMRSDILMRQGKTADALASYQDLVKQSSSDDNRTVAELGVMRAAKQLARWQDVKETTANLLGRGNLTAAEEKEVMMNSAIADSHLGDAKAAQATLKKLAADTQSAEGAQAAYELVNLQFETGNLKDAERTANAFVDAGTPHHYWLAKTFILLSDIYAKQGKTSQAREYLQSLKNNYPGKEKDITEAIDSRLRSLASTKKNNNTKK
ncbi:MAG: tetratricopeptide repeat protein [Muribaculaceae bacterium]|nr:tetratricopeptide repeat protein [Muribaculaceae bacterium]